MTKKTITSPAMLLWGRNVGYNEVTRKTDWGERDKAAALDERSDKQRQDQ